MDVLIHTGLSTGLYGRRMLSKCNCLIGQGFLSGSSLACCPHLGCSCSYSDVTMLLTSDSALGPFTNLVDIPLTKYCSDWMYWVEVRGIIVMIGRIGEEW